MAPSVDPSQWTYTDYVCFLRSHGFHNLGVLDEYLQWGASARVSPNVRRPEASRTVLLEFAKNTTRISDLSDLTKLRLLLQEWTRPNSAPHSPGSGPEGRIVLVENISPAMVDTLGGVLNLEPTFFASHLEDTGFSRAPDASSSPALPSTTARNQQHFFVLEYISAFIPVGCGKEVESLPLQCTGNYSRRIELIHKQGKQKVALARRKISFYSKKGDGAWLCVVLVDPPLSSFTIGNTNFNLATPSQQFEVMGYQGGYVDFIEMRKPLNRQRHDFRDCRARSQCQAPFDDLTRHWQIQARDGLLQNDDGDLVTIMRPAFQMAASECGTFFEYIRNTLESQHLSTILTSDPQKIKRNLDRCIFLDTLLSRYKPILSRIKDYVHSNADLKEDFRHLMIDLHHHRADCDSQMQHITSTLQSYESSQMQNLNSEAMRRADYMRYLTIIALIYAPFALACAIFSMPREFAPAAHYLYGFVPVTAVVTILFLLLVLPESRDPLPSLKAAICGKLSREKLLAKHRPESRGGESRGSSKRYGLEEV